MTTFLLPSDVLTPSRPDEHFAWRSAVAREHGPVALVDLDVLASDGPRALRRVPPGDDVVYLGWMLTPQAYADLDRAVAAAGARLRTSPEEYARAHHLPGWYPTFAALTPASAWFAVDAPAQTLVDGARALGSGAFVVKDHVKSRKHEWESACFAPDADAVPRVCAELVRLAEGDVAGGLVVRAFEDLHGPEARVWWVDGRVAAVTAHPDTPDEVPGVRVDDAVGDAVRGLGCGFVTTDLARRADGVWRVVEVGDGQVSDVPHDTVALDRVLAALTGV